MYVDIIEMPELKAAVLEIPRDGGEVRKAWKKVSELLGGHSAVQDPDNGYVFIPEWQWATEVTTLWVGMLVSGFEGLPDGLAQVTIPAKRFARLRVKGDRKQMEQCYGYLFEWFDKSPHRRDVREGSLGFEKNALHPVNPFDIPADEINEFDFYIHAPLIEPAESSDPYSGIISVEVKEAGPRRIVGVEAFIDRNLVQAHQAVPELWQRIMPRLKEVGSVKAPFATFGLYGYEPPFGPGQNFRYLAGVESAPHSSEPLPDGMADRVIPGGEFVTVTYKGTASGLEQTWNYFHQVWFPLQTDYDAIDEFEFERHDGRFQGTDNEQSVMEMHFPVKRRVQERRLTDKIVVDEKGRHLLQDLRNENIRMASFQGSSFHGIDMRDTALRYVNFVHSEWEHIYFAGVHIRSIQMGGTVFEDIRRPEAPMSRLDAEPGTDGWVNVEPVVFRNSDLSTGRFENCDLSGVQLNGCRLDGMTIDGIPVTELLDDYLKRKEA